MTWLRARYYMITALLGSSGYVDSFKIQLEDGSGSILLEDGTSYVLQEGAP